MVRQEWNKWNIDAFFPMNYNDFYLEDASWLAPIVKEEVASVQGKKPVYSGLFICEDWQNKANIKDPEGHGLIPSEIEEAVRGSMENGAAGVALFTPGNMTDEHWKAFDKAIHGRARKALIRNYYTINKDKEAQLFISRLRPLLLTPFTYPSPNLSY